MPLRVKVPCMGLRANTLLHLWLKRCQRLFSSCKNQVSVGDRTCKLTSQGKGREKHCENSIRAKRSWEAQAGNTPGTSVFYSMGKCPLISLGSNSDCTLQQVFCDVMLVYLQWYQLQLMNVPVTGLLPWKQEGLQTTWFIEIIASIKHFLLFWVLI